MHQKNSHQPDDNSTDTSSLKCSTNVCLLAPEVILPASSEGGLSEASDVWQLGISLFALGCGQMPFQTEEEVCYARNLPWHLYSGIPISDAYKSFI